FFSFYISHDNRALHSFPTRRSSDLGLLITSSIPTVTGCVFTDNDAGFNGGGLAVVGSEGAVSDCVFSGNHAYQGGGMSVESSTIDRKSTRLNSSHVAISYAVFCLKK